MQTPLPPERVLRYDTRTMNDHCRIVCVLLWGGSLLAAGGCHSIDSSASQQLGPVEFPILWEHHGSVSHISRPLQVVAHSPEVLAQLPLVEVPVDFETQMVLVAGIGPTTRQDLGVRINRVWRDGSRIRVQVQTLYAAEEKPEGPPRLVSPYHVVVVPRSDLNIVGFSAAVPRGAFRGPALPGAATASPD